MHPNAAFRKMSEATNLRFACERGFGTLCVNGENGPLLAHVPFIVNDDGSEAELHLVRSNPIAQAAEDEVPAVLSVQGPDGYVSPDWYEAADQVPTWNYVAVHLRGSLKALDHDTMRAHLDRVSEGFETRLAKAPWTADKMNPEALDRMMRAIQPFRLRVAEINGTWKLNQNKPDAMRFAAAGKIGTGVGQDLERLAILMRHGGPEMDKP